MACSSPLPPCVKLWDLPSDTSPPELLEASHLLLSYISGVKRAFRTRHSHEERGILNLSEIKGIGNWLTVKVLSSEAPETSSLPYLGAFSPHLFSVPQVDCLVLQLHRIGEQLEKMNSQRMDELFFLLRDGFLLQEGLSSLSQLLLLEIIEFRAADWKMTEAAQKYYYSELTD